MAPENILDYDYEKFGGRLINYALSGAGVHARWRGNLKDVTAKARAKQEDIDELFRDYFDDTLGGRISSSMDKAWNVVGGGLHEGWVWSVSPGVQRYVLGALALVSFAI